MPKPLPPSPRRRVANYALAAVAALLAVALRAALRPLLGDSIPFIFLFPAISWAALRGGLDAALVATAVGAVGADVMLMAPIGSLALPAGVDRLNLLLFLAVGAGVSALAARARDLHLRLGLEHEKLTVTLGSIGDAVIVADLQRRVTFLNAEAERLTGVARAAAVGRPLDEVFRIQNEESGAPVPCPVERVLRTGRVVGLANHTVILRPDGTQSPIDDSAAPIRDGEGTLSGVVLVFRDIGERRAAERRLQRSEAEARQRAEDLAAVLAAVPAAIWIADDPSCDRITGNPEACRLLGLGSDDNVSTTNPDRPRRTFRQERGGRPVPREELPMRRAVRTGEPVNNDDLSVVFEEGQVVHLHGNTRPLRDGEGRVRGAVSAFVDVTALKRIEADLREEHRRKDEFLATLAHELRNPLAPVRSGLELLRRAPPGGEEAVRALLMMERQTTHMVRLIDDLLDVSRITRGTLELRRQPVLLSEVVTTALEAAAPHLQAGRHALQVRLPEAPLTLEADPARLAQVLGNLLHNAAKYTPPGGRIELRAEVRDGEVSLTVTDEGVGIPRDMLPRVFDLFTQVQRDRDRAQGGLGIGLSLVRRLVELHGGAASAASEGEGKGSAFTVRLPLRAPEGSADAGAGPYLERTPSFDGDPPTPATAPTPALAGRRVLIVDDNQDAAESICMVLELDGFLVSVAHDGASALERARTFRPEAVLLDIGLPDLDGYEVARQLRAEHGAALHLIALTGWGSEADRRRSREAGFNRHLTKPASPAAIAAALAAR